ncbi:hypothetical protein AB5I41_21360 [Sphingomonas sp. MMS24-JH45]
MEERLSDALHASLTQRFVDKRTTALMKTIGTGAGELPVEIDAQGEVTIEHPCDRPAGRFPASTSHPTRGRRTSAGCSLRRRSGSTGAAAARGRFDGSGGRRLRH